MNRRVRAPFVTTVASVVFAGAALTGSACGPNPPELGDCPADTPNNGGSCSGRASCIYETPGCEGSSSTWTHASCVRDAWVVRQEGTSCNPPFPIDSGSETSSDAVTDGGACPASEPAIGSACAGSAVCSFPNLCPQTSAIKANIYRCVGDKWSFDNTLESPVECPKLEPRDGEACGCAMYLAGKCTYPASCGSDEAVCDGATQKWRLKPATCADAGPETAPDTSSDALAD